MVHHIASISKPITAVAVMQLVESGKIDLDADIHSYLPAYPKKPWPFTNAPTVGDIRPVCRHYRPGEARNDAKLPLVGRRDGRLSGR